MGTAETLSLTLSGVPVELRGDGSVWLPRRRMLLVADLHLGKGAVFRRSGVPVPSGDSARDLARLAQAVADTDADSVAVLGDLAHGPGSYEGHVAAALREWRSRHPGVTLTLVAGNHDALAGAPPEDAGIRQVSDPWVLGPEILRHHPPPRAAAPEGGVVFAGHLHPVAVLRGAGDRARLPCFWWRPPVLVLPAWGSFTGGHPVRPRRGERVFVCVEDTVTEVPLGG